MPKEWKADDPILKSPHAPHEVAAVLRMNRAGWPGELIMRELGVRASRLVGELSKSITEADLAAKANRPIHDAPVPQGTE